MGGISAPNNSLGSGQTWQNMNASRSEYVNYTNTTGKTICISFFGYSTSATGYVYIDGLQIFGGLCRSTYFNTLPVTFIVPPNSSYQIGGFDYYGSWFELRG